MSLHPECQDVGCRRGQEATPCRIAGGCGVEWARACVVCTTRLEHGHICPACSQRIVDDLDAIVHLAAEAASQLVPATKAGQGRSVPASRPPLSVEALDPELSLVRIVDGDPSSDVPLLVVLEDWERIVREDRGLAPYGPASQARLRERAPHHAPTFATLTGVIGFLRAQHLWIIAEPTFDLGEYARQVKLCRKAVARWDVDRMEGGWRVPCPTTTEAGDCLNPLRVARGEESVYCRRCQRDWELTRLLAVAGRDADVWVDIEAAATLAGVTERTIRNWVKRKEVTKRGNLVRVQDVRAYAHTLGA